jgi:hypothetical protein
MQHAGPVSPTIDNKLTTRLLTENLPGLREQGNNLIRAAGDWLRSNDPAGFYKIDEGEMTARAGAFDQGGLRHLLQTLMSEDYLDWQLVGPDFLGLRLKSRGWDRYDELQRAHTEGNLAFMAMPFGKDELDRIFSDHWRPAVAATGFDLRRIDHEPQAGLIDNRLRVEIRKSRFLLAEITDGNAGAYWEAGFAEGLGRPVIYLCEREHFKKAHFDTNHHHTVIWERDNLGPAVQTLKDTIRATLPSEAKLSDA